MKNFLRVTVLAICAIFMVANVSAQVITAERASEIANQFFANGKQKSAAFRSTSATLTQSVDSHAITGESNEAPTFHILTGADGKGFVIVSGEETENPIIGYSLDGTIDTNNLPDGFVDYMTDIDAQVRALREYNAANPQKAAARSAMQKAADFEYNATTMGNIVKNLNTAPWGQRTPFNNLCKTTDGQTALTGCGPTAFAILCYYHKWPASGVGTVTHQGTGENMELGHTYDYASMRNDDYRSGYTEAEANAVAVLMRDLGWACEVGYGTGSTSYGETSRHLTEHFYYKDIRTANSNSGATYRNDDEEWKRLIKESLDKEYPIPYSSTTGGTLRHIYILDGYTDNDYYHFNWGWSGQGNGWFTLDNMVPDDYSNYSNSHRAYFNLIPDKTTYTVTATVNDSNMGTVSINGGTAGSTATADFFSGATATLTAHPTQGYALASWTKNGVVVGSRNTIQVTVGTDANDYVANFDNEANVTIVKDYTISSTTGELTNDGTSATKFSQWASNEEPVLKLNATCGKTVANSMSVVDDVLQLYAYDYDKANGYTYTINAPDGYLITSYSLTYYMSSSFNITVSNETTTQTASRSDQTLSASGLSKESASFTLTGAAANNLVKVRSFTVTIQKEGANVPSTPTTYTINVNAETGGNAYVNGTNTSATVDAGTDVTLQAYPDGTNYTFAGWYNGNSWVSSNNPYTFALNSNVTYTAKFNAVATTYAVTTTANPAAGGTAKFAVGTGSQKTQGDVENGTQITLYATANTGYNFVNWTLGGNVVSTDATCNVNVAQASNYVANFEAEANEPVEVSGDLEFTFTRDGENATVTVNGADGVTATITATSASNAWNTGGAMASRTDVLCQNTNTNATSATSPITYTLTVNGLSNATTITSAAFTHVAVNSGGNLQPSNDTDVRHCNFKLEANNEAVGTTLSDHNIWIPNGNTDKTINFDNISVNADGTLTIKLTLYKGTNNNGCYYGLTKITLTAVETGPLAGKLFRIKAKNTSNYMNIANTSNNGGSTSGVTVVAKNESSDTQVFLFEQSGNGYKLKAKSGNYIKCHAWNANANATAAADATELTFETTGTELEYLIKWDNKNMNEGVERDDYFKYQNVNGTLYVYCDAAANAAATWVLEEVKYTVTATANPGTAGTVTVNGIAGQDEVSYKGSATLKATITDNNYIFVNWTQNGAEVSTEATYTVNNIKANANYVANFNKKAVQINVELSEGGTATINGEQTTSKEVETGSEVTVVATPSTGYHFINWTNGTEVASTNATYTFTATANTTLKANFEKKIVNVTLRDDTNENIEAAKRHVYEFVLDNLEGEATTDAIAAKLMEKYPVIESLGSGTNTTLIDNGTSYTYTNSVKLQFLIANGRDDDGITWYNIYYPVNINNQPNYLAASSSESTYVEKINDDTYAYGANPTYNKEIGNAPISWAIYSVDHTLTFALKNKVAGKFIQVTSVATGNAQNAVFTNEANATAFAISKKTINPVDYYAFAAEIDGTTGYLSSTDNNYDYATLFNSNDNPGAWAIVEDPAYYTQYIELLWGLWEWFAPVDGLCTVTKEIQDIKDALNDYENITLNTLKNYGLILEAANLTWPTITLDIKPNKDCGATNINGEEGMTSRRAPADYVFPVEAIPAEGYHFTKWTDATDNTLSTDAKYFTSISGKTGDVTTITANFEINTYNINVTAGEGGSATASSATVEHGSEVTLTATPSTGYEFIGWYNGEELVSNEATYTFTATSDINYTARFNEVPTGTVAIHITVASTDGTTVTNNATGNVKAIINNIGQEWATDADFVVGADVELVATNDYDQKAYLFDGWYKNDVLVSNELEITVKVTEAATYEARFFRGCIVIGEPKSSSKGYVTKITLADGTSLGYDASNRAVVKPGTTVKINTYIEKEYEVGSWTDKGGNVVGNDKDLIIVIHNDATYTANIESAFYYLTVRANDDNYGTAEVILGTAAPATTVKVNKNMSATITATANTGYYFVNWTKGGEVVSTSATYEIAGIANVENLIDVEYVANFLPVENATAGVYYRIGYDGFAAAASAGAARAAGDVVTIDLTTGVFGGQTGDKTTYSQWTSDNGVNIIARDANGTEIASMKYNNGFQLLLIDGVTTPVEYTITVPEGYTLTEMSYKNGSRTYDMTVSYNSENVSLNGGTSIQTITFIEGETSFKLSGSIGRYIYITALTMIETGNSEGDEGEGSGETPETPANRYYMQSEACGVSGGNNLQNALKMTKDTTATSIFYYADSKLLSYDKGQYIIENGGTRGLQAVGVSGTVTITTSGETATISAPNYMHANKNGTTYYADHCGSNTGTAAHANHNFVLEEVTTLPVTISSALHATFYAPVAVKIPEGVKAYVLKAEDIPGIETYAWMTSLKNGIIPANTGVIIKGAEGTYYFDIVENNDAARAEAVGNVLSGTVAKTKIIEDAYILANREGKIGLYPVAKNSYLDNSTNGTTVRFTNNSHKAYLPVTDDWFGEQLKKGTGFRFVYDDEETTGIDEFETELEDTIYDLQGRKLSEITEPGIYIVGGKKVWIK